MARYLFLLVFATLFRNSLQEGCQTVRISGSTTDQVGRMTTYTMTGQTHGGRPVYQSSSGDYLYYQTSDTTWNVGPTLGSSSVGMYLRHSSMYADSTSGTWYLYDGVNDFRANSLVSVTGTCSTSSGLSTGAIIGIVVGIFFAVVLIVVVLCCVLCCAACKKSGSVAAVPHNTHSTAVPAPSGPPPMYSGPGYPPPQPGYPPPQPPPEQERGPDSLLIIGVVRLQPRDTAAD